LSDWFIELLKVGAHRAAAVLARGASVKTPHYEIRAPTTDGVVTIMQAVHELAATRPLPRSPNGDSVATTVQAEEPMTVKG